MEALEAALAHNATFLGIGVEREERPASALSGSGGGIPDALLRYFELAAPEEDISDYIGREGDDESRPRLGKDAPDSVRPKKEPAVSPRVHQIALGHPADSITFGFSGASDDKAPVSNPTPPESPGVLSRPRAGKKLLVAACRELRAPLDEVLGMLRMLQQSFLTEEQEEWTRTAGHSAQKLLRAISDMPDFFTGES